MDEDTERVNTGLVDTAEDTGRRTTTSEMAVPSAVEFPLRYTVDRVLGEGGMGKVLLCGDSVIGRRVAMKVIRTQTAGDSEAVRFRFLREARIQGQLEHPAIVPVYDIGTDPSGAVFFTMKRVRGVTLAEIIARLRVNDPETVDKYTPRRLLAAFGSVCLSSEFAHQHGVVHRDLKPANIMLGKYGEVYVLDWGIAHIDAEPEPNRPSALDLAEPTSAQRTQSILGTLGYMAPEQLRQVAGDARSDVYALGAILFEILTLHRLHDYTASDELAASTLTGADARPSTRAPERHVAPELDEICVRATALDPRERFASARALAEAIEHHLDREQNVEMRRGEAVKHVAAAEMLTTAHGNKPQRALREIGQALVLDPQNKEALRAMARLFSTPPERTPEVVVDEIEKAGLARRRFMGKVGAASYASFFLYLPAFLLMGVRNWTAFFACHVLVLAAAAWTFLNARFGDASIRATYIAIALTNLAFATCSALFGPMIMIPGPIIANTIGFCLLYPNTRSRLVAIVAGVAALVIPLVMQTIGVVPSSYAFSEQGMLVKPIALNLPSTLTLGVLLFGNAMPIIAGALAVGKLRDALHTAELRLHTQAWQLRQLLPDDVFVIRD